MSVSVAVAVSVAISVAVGADAGHRGDQRSHNLSAARINGGGDVGRRVGVINSVAVALGVIVGANAVIRRPRG